MNLKNKLIKKLEDLGEVLDALSETGEPLKKTLLLYIEIIMYIIMICLAYTGQVVLLPGCWAVLNQIKSVKSPPS